MRKINDDELREIVANLAISQTQADARQAKTDEQFAKSKAEDAKRKAEADEQFAKSKAEYEARQAKIDAMFEKSKAEDAKRQAEYEVRQAKLDKQMANVLGFIGNSADILENKFATAIEDSDMVIDNIQYDEMETNFKGRNKQLQGEYDIVLFNSSHLFIVEVKRKPHINDFKQILKHKKIFPQLFKGYDDFTIHLGLAGEAFYPEVIQEAQRLGIYILKTKENDLEIITP